MYSVPSYSFTESSTDANNSRKLFPLCPPFFASLSNPRARDLFFCNSDEDERTRRKRAYQFCLASLKVHSGKWAPPYLLPISAIPLPLPEYSSDDAAINKHRHHLHHYHRSSHYCYVSTPQLPLSAPHLPVAAPNLPLSTSQLPLSTSQLPLSTPHQPLSTPQLPLSTSQLPLSTSQLALSTPQLPVSTPPVANKNDRRTTTTTTHQNLTVKPLMTPDSTPPDLGHPFFLAVGGHSGIWLSPITTPKNIRKACYLRESLFYSHLFAHSTDFRVFPEDQREQLSQMATSIWTLPSSANPLQPRSESAGEQKLFYKYLRQIVPMCSAVGLLKDNNLVEDKRLKYFVELENLTHGLTQPLVMDLAIGTTLYEEGADNEKRNKMIAKAQRTTAGCFGLRLTAIKGTTWKGDPVEVSRSYGRAAKCLRDILRGIRTFFSAIHPSARHQVDIQLSQFVAQLRDRWAKQSCYSLCGSSLLVVVDTKKIPQDENNNHTLLVEGLCTVRLIDFAHASALHVDETVPLKTDFHETISSSYDGVANNVWGDREDGFLLGLDSLLTLLENFRKERRNNVKAIVHCETPNNFSRCCELINN